MLIHLFVFWNKKRSVHWNQYFFSIFFFNLLIISSLIRSFSSTLLPPCSFIIITHNKSAQTKASLRAVQTPDPDLPPISGAANFAQNKMSLSIFLRPALIMRRSPSDNEGQDGGDLITCGGPITGTHSGPPDQGPWANGSIHLPQRSADDQL